MDLAEIRRKAQQERERGPDRDSLNSEQNLEDKTSGTMAQSVEIPANVVLEPASVPGVGVTPSSDPISVLLAGRAKMATDNLFVAELETDVESNVEKPVELLCFLVGQEEYAINILDIKEIIKPRDITEVPRVPGFISGILSLRGVIIPVFNMHERLDLANIQSTGKERIIVVKYGEELYGVMVDEVIQVVRIAVSGIEPTPTVLDGINREFVSGIGRFDGRMIILLNLHNILDISLC